jgi:hypothetical protein
MKLKNYSKMSAVLLLTEKEGIRNLIKTSISELVKFSHPCHRLHIDYPRVLIPSSVFSKATEQKEIALRMDFFTFTTDASELEFSHRTSSAQLSTRPVPLNIDSEIGAAVIVAPASTYV